MQYQLLEIAWSVDSLEAYARISDFNIWVPFKFFYPKV